MQVLIFSNSGLLQPCGWRGASPLTVLYKPLRIMQHRPTRLLTPDRNPQAPLEGTSIKVYSGVGKRCLGLDFWLEKHFHRARNTSTALLCTHLGQFYNHQERKALTKVVCAKIVVSRATLG